MDQGWQEGETMNVVFGGRHYAVDRDWARLQASRHGAVLSDLACLGDRVYVLQRADPPLLVFDCAGHPVNTFGSGLILDGHGVTTGAGGTLLVADRDAHQIVRFSAEGKLLQQWGKRHAPRWQAPFNHPTGAAEDGAGRLWVADGYGNACLHRFDVAGALEKSFGNLGDAPGAFLVPHAVAVAADGRVLVADRDNNRVQLFDAEGALQQIWGGFERPMSVAVEPGGWAWITDQVPSLHRIALDGGGRTRARPAASMPHGLALADDGTVYVVEMSPPSLVRLRPLD